MAEQRDLVVVGASAGGVEALQSFVSNLRHDLPAAVVVVLHMPSGGGLSLSRILDRAGPLPFVPASDGLRMLRGTGYVSVGGHHLLVAGGRLLVQRGPRENGHRPAIDPLFRSAARDFGPGVVGVVLSGTLDDGAAGLRTIQRQGGIPLVQRVDEALFGDMPRSALAATHDARVGSAAELAAMVNELVGDNVPPSPDAPDTLDREVRIVEQFDQPTTAPAQHPGEPSQWPCPDCNGVLWRIDDDPLRFRCRVGHAWSADSLARRQDLEVETALWAALRALEDRAALADRMAERASTADRRHSAWRFREDASDMLKSAALLRNLLESFGSGDETEASG